MYALRSRTDCRPFRRRALRAGLPKLKGNLLIGVINSIGKRRTRRPPPQNDLGADAVSPRGGRGIGQHRRNAAAKDLHRLAKTSGATKWRRRRVPLCRRFGGGQRDQALALSPPQRSQRPQAAPWPPWRDHPRETAIGRPRM
jgi:hypothetical protein